MIGKVEYYWGIDPGLQDTGLVELTIPHDTAEPITSKDFVVKGINVQEIAQRVGAWDAFVEDYRVRSGFSTNSAMMKGIGELKQVLPRLTIVPNQDSKFVVSNEMLKLLGLYNSPVKSNHQDIRAAKRIALFGLIRENSEMNTLIARHILARLKER